MKPINRQVLRWAGVSVAAAILAGCASWPTPADPQTAYLVASYRVTLDIKLSSEAASLANQVANRRLRELLPGDDLPGCLAYLEQLERPIVLDPDLVGQDTVLKPDQKKTVRTWLAAHPEKSRLNGSEVSANWRQALLAAQNRAAEFKRQFASLMAQGDQSVRAGKYPDAVQSYEAALKIDPSSTSAQDLRRTARTQWVGATFDQLLPVVHTARKQAEDCMQVSHTADSSERRLVGCLAIIDKAQLKLDDFRAWGQQNEDFIAAIQQKSAELQAEETALADLRGRSWGEVLWLRGNETRFWDAYQYHTAKWEQTTVELPGGKRHRFEPVERTMLRTRLRAAYEEFLPLALAYHIRNSQARFGESRFGLTIILLRMGQEMLDYHRGLNFSLTADLTELQRQLNFSVKETQEKLTELALSRRIMLGEFKGKGPDGEDLSEMIYDRWMERYTEYGPKGGPSTYYGVKMERSTAEPAPLDYVVAGHINAFFVETLTDVERSATDIAIGREVVYLTKSPSGKKLDPPLYEQDVLIFVKRVTQKAKKATLRATITVAHAGETGPLKSFNEEFNGTNNPLTGIILSADEIRFHEVSSKTIKNSDRSVLRKVEPVPTNIPAKLSTDRDIGQAAADLAVDQLLASLQAKVTQFPLQDLIRQAVLQQKQGKTVESADYLGQCLEYVYQLTVNDKDATAPTDWPATRQAVLEKIARLNKTVWDTENPEWKAEIGNIWKQSVTATLETLKSK